MENPLFFNGWFGGGFNPTIFGKKNKCLSHLPPLDRLKAFDFITHFASVILMAVAWEKKTSPKATNHRLEMGGSKNGGTFKTPQTDHF